MGLVTKIGCTLAITAGEFMGVEFVESEVTRGDDLGGEEGCALVLNGEGCIGELERAKRGSEPVFCNAGTLRGGRPPLLDIWCVTPKGLGED
jgi:hypothetical protein